MLDLNRVKERTSTQSNETRKELQIVFKLQTAEMAFSFVFLLFLLPGSSYMSYRKYSLSTLCTAQITDPYIDSVYHDKDTNTIDLNDSPSMSSALLDHVWDNSSFEHFHQCEFTVKAHSKWTYGGSSGLIAAVRELNFRQDGKGECIDYVIFELNTLTAPTSYKFCGKVQDDDNMLDEKHFFEVPEGFLKVIIRIGPHNLEPNEIVMKLTFTAFEDCSGSYTFRCTNNKCISEDLYNDFVVNCIPPFCTDEPRFFDKCRRIPPYFMSYMRIIVVGFTLTLIMFGVVTAWYCFKFYVSYGPFVNIAANEHANPAVE